MTADEARAAQFRRDQQELARIYRRDLWELRGDRDAKAAVVEAWEPVRRYLTELELGEDD